MSLFRDRFDAGRQLADVLDRRSLEDAVVVGLARGGVEVAVEVARELALPLDAVAVRKIGHPWQPEYGIGAVTPGGDGVYVRSHDGLDDEELARAVEQARSKAAVLDRTLHEHHSPIPLDGRTALLVDDGLATGATMVASVRWARSRGAGRVVVAVPVGAAQSLELLRAEADEVVCPHAEQEFWAVGLWYDDFRQVSDTEVLALLERAAREAPASGEGLAPESG